MADQALMALEDDYLQTIQAAPTLIGNLPKDDETEVEVEKASHSCSSFWLADNNNEKPEKDKNERRNWAKFPAD